MPSRQHESIVDYFCTEYGFQRNHFTRSLKRAVSDPIFSLDQSGFRYIPDCYHMDHDSKAVIVIEVEIGYPLTDDKLRQYRHLWSAVDCTEWCLELLTVDKFLKVRHANLFDSLTYDPDGVNTLEDDPLMVQLLGNIVPVAA